MSAICLMEFNAKQLSFEKLNKLANEIIANALSNNYAAFFNDCYAENFIKDKERMTYLLLSDSFLYRNADDLLDVTAFVYEADEIYKKKFIEKYSFFSKLIDIIFKYEIDVIDLYITEQGDNKFDEYIFEGVKKEKLLEKLFDAFIKSSSQTGYTFPNIKIHIKKN